MDLTFSSLFTTTFYSSVLFLCIFFMLKKANRMRQVGVRTLILCILLILLKLMFPYEFFFSKNINLTLLYPKYTNFCTALWSCLKTKQSSLLIFFVLFGVQVLFIT